MEYQDRIAQFEDFISNNLLDEPGLGSGGYGILIRMIPALGQDRPAFVQAMRNLLRRDEVQLRVKVGIISLASLNIGEISDAVLELHEQISPDTSEYTPGVLPDSLSVCLRLMINKFLVYQNLAR